jgi:twinkle protein
MISEPVRPINPVHVTWLESRHLDPERAAAMGIYSAKRSGTGEAEPTPHASGDILVFPYFEAGREVNAKFRAPQKKFFQRAKARKTFWNVDVLEDPAMHDGRHPLLITEGELDALAAIQVGHPWSVSVPDGAPADRDANGRPIPMRPDSELDPTNDPKFEYLVNNWDRLERVKRIILATDGDGPGERLRDELARRIGRVRCFFVEYPKDPVVEDVEKSTRRPAKDLNEVLVHFGPEEVLRVIQDARAYPVKGLYKLSQYPELPPIPAFSTGWPILDQHLKVFAGEFMVVTGIPSHGKSTWVMNLVVNLAESRGWSAAIFSPEMPTVPHLRDKLRKIKLRKTPLDIEWEDIAIVDQWIDRTLVFIDVDPAGQSDDDPTLEWILDRARDAVVRDGIRILVIDPWNEIEHARRGGESMADYIGRGIRALKRFGQQYGVAVIVVVHPTKEVGKEGKARQPTLYDCADSAHWFNKPDHGVVVFRPDEGNQTVIRVAKVRFDTTGEKGTIRLEFHHDSSRFEQIDPDAYAHVGM